MEIKLGQRMVLERRVSRPYLKIVDEYVYYVPFLDSLCRLLSDSFVFEEVSTGTLSLCNVVYVGQASMPSFA